MGEEDLTLIVQMVEGKLALHNFGEVNNAYLVTENLPDYLSAVAGELDTLLPYFKEIPAKNEYFENEIRVLRRIHSLSDRLKQGKLDDIDTRAIFWGLQEL